MTQPVHLVTITAEARQCLYQLPAFIKIGHLLQFSGIVPKDGKVIVKVCRGPRGSTSVIVHKRSAQVKYLCEAYLPFIQEMSEINFGHL